jgi:glycosyltransferase involved in cell wall biosynthesis
LVRHHRIEVVHCHNVFPTLSPAVIRAVTALDVPCVLTLHNFRYLCLPATLLRDGRICEDCLGRPPWPGVVHRCYRGSTTGSAVLAASLTAHRALATFERPALSLAVSEFVRDKYLAAGWSPDRTVVKPNFTWPAPRRVGPGSYHLYVGRLSSEKGLLELLATWHHIDAPLILVGSGPLEDELRRVAPPNVELRGSVAPAAVAELIAGARSVVLPSRCFEGQPRSILEAYAAGVPVLASDIGGLPEVVVPDETGFLVPIGDEGAWIEATNRLRVDADCERLGAGAYELWHRRFGPEVALSELEAVYRRVVHAGAG